MSDVRPEISYLPPQGDPLGVNPWFRFGAAVLKPILNSIIQKDWKGAQHLPKSGAAIVVCN
ncbi:MAG: 1-acyl-sn-glycerol-3-phosphate acyltransferase, partial [Actinomycetota bacterium]